MPCAAITLGARGGAFTPARIFCVRRYWRRLSFIRGRHVGCSRHGPPGYLVVGAQAPPAETERFLLKVLKPLVSAGVLYSVRGPNGGYRLARPAKGITLLDVVEAVDGPVRGETPRWAAAAGHKLNARLQQVCDAGAEEVRGRLRKVSLAYLAGEGNG